MTRVGFRLRQGDVAASRAAMEADMAHRRRTQPLGWPTWGSTFRNPPGDHAGRLIEAAGLKGHREGNAMWSDAPRQLHRQPGRGHGRATASRSSGWRGRGSGSGSAWSWSSRCGSPARSRRTSIPERWRSSWVAGVGKKVAVLYGGRSAEREVSLKTGKACAEALRSRGLDVTLVDAGLDLAERLRACGAEVAFLALHGRFGRGRLRRRGCSSRWASRTPARACWRRPWAWTRSFSKLVFRDAGLSLAPYRVFPRSRAASVTVADLPFGLPAVVKPACEGSSVGVHVVKEPASSPPALADAASFQGDVIVEQYLRGQEVNVAVLDGEPLGAIEMVPSREFYDYMAKYTPGSTQYFFPARLSPEVTGAGLRGRRDGLPRARLRRRGPGRLHRGRRRDPLHPRGEHAARA